MNRKSSQAGTKACDHFREKEDLEAALEQAESNATGTFETRFIDDMTTRHDKYGFDMFMSEAQFETLHRISIKHIK